MSKAEGTTQKALELATERGVAINTIHADLSEFVIEAGQWVVSRLLILLQSILLELKS